MGDWELKIDGLEIGTDVAQYHCLLKKNFVDEFFVFP
jgi:hypothetical protein